MTAAFCVNALLAVAFAAAPPAKPDAPAAKKPGVKVTISKETTYITEPLRADGYVDYVAALNQRGSQGVTPENNAAVLFWKARGPAETPQEQREEFFKLLGIPPLPEKGDYFVPLGRYVQRLREAQGVAAPAKVANAITYEEALRQLSSASTRPWAKQDFPVLAEWLAASEKQLAIVVEATTRARWYDPLVASRLASALPRVQHQRETSRALSVRATLRIGEGKIEEAWSDLLACHRAARLAGQGPTMIDAILAIAVDGVACTGDQALLQHARPTAAQIAKMRKDLDGLSAMPKMADKDLAERFYFLDYVAVGARDGLAAYRNLESEAIGAGAVNSVIDQAGTVTIDWDQVAREGNSWFDRVMEARRTIDPRKRKAALGKLEADTRNIAATLDDVKTLRSLPSSKARQVIASRVGRVFVAFITPELSAANDAQDRQTMQFDLVRLAFALAAYRADRGSYPAKLADLSPKYLAEIPRDIFTGADLHYERTGKGYLLYSVGINGKDDGGKTYDDCTNGETCDDLTVRIR